MVYVTVHPSYLDEVKSLSLYSVSCYTCLRSPALKVFPMILAQRSCNGSLPAMMPGLALCPGLVSMFGSLSLLNILAIFYSIQFNFLYLYSANNN